MATLLANDSFQLSIDLSGGLDSRMVFSLLHLVMREAPTESMERVSIYSHGFISSVDLEIAEEVLCASESALPHAQHWRRSFSIFPGSGLAERPFPRSTARLVVPLWRDLQPELSNFSAASP